MTSGTLTLTEGAVSVNANGAHFDAAVASDTIAGFEIGLADANVYVGEQSDRREPLMLTVATSRGAMEQLAIALVNALDWPAFTEREWLRIAGVLEAVHGGDELDEIARRIRDAYRR